jgi:hypothetical protein
MIHHPRLSAFINFCAEQLPVGRRYQLVSLLDGPLWRPIAEALHAVRHSVVRVAHVNMHTELGGCFG